MNLGCADAAALVAALSRGVAAGQDIGSLAHLREYERARQLGNSGMILGVDVVKRMFDDTTGFNILAPFRSLGMAAINTIEPLKVAVAVAAVRCDDGITMPMLACLRSAGPHHVRCHGQAPARRTLIVAVSVRVRVRVSAA